jgi:hypothetical protein
VLTDSGSGVELEVFYRLPTNAERIAFNKKLKVKKKGNIVEMSQKLARQKVLPLLKRFRWPDSDPDTRVHLEIDDKLVPLSCEQNDPGYREDWRSLLGKALPNMFEYLGNILFSGVSDDEADDDDEEDEDYPN